MASAVAESTWLLGLFNELGAQIQMPITIMIDSNSVVQLAANPVLHET